MVSYKFVLSIVAACLLVSCGGEPGSDLALSEGWVQSGNRLWLAGADTAGAFRDLETLGAMGIQVEDVVYNLGNRTSVQQLVNAVRLDLIDLFRYHPEVVDSLYRFKMRPRILETNAGSGVDAVRDRLKKDAFRTLTRHFRQPYPRTRLGSRSQARSDTSIIPVVIPDSLRGTERRGSVRMQVRINERGEPMAVLLKRPLHPVLDQIALATATKMRWHPAYLDGVALSSWVQFSMRF